MKKTSLFAVAVMTAVVAFAEPYTKLFRIANPQGDCRVKKPDAAAFEPAQRNKAYPFGTRVECGKDSSAVLVFSDADAVRMLADTRAIVNFEEGRGSRAVTLVRGTLLTRIGANTADDFVVVDTPAGRVRSISGNCKITLTQTPATKSSPEMVDVEFRAEPSSRMRLIGRQFIIPVLKNGFGALVSSRTDGSYTIITDQLGDYDIYVNIGLDADPPDPYEENANLSRIKMSTKAALRIWREKAAIGDTTVVAVLATTPAGKGRESFAFAVGKADIAARSNVFMDTITNELAVAEQAKAGGEAQGDEMDFGSGDDFGDFGSGDNLGGDADGGNADGDAGDANKSTTDDSLYDFLI